MFPSIHPAARAFIRATAALFLLLPVAGGAMERPRPGEIERYRRDGSLPARLEFARGIANHRIHPALAARRLRAAAAQPAPVARTAILPYDTGLPSSGSPKVLCILIDFPDYEHVNDRSVFVERLFGDGNPAEYPYESLSNFYRRSSYSTLSISGDVLGWFRAPLSRNRYRTYSAIKQLIKTALDYYNPSVDYSQYDGDGDGVIDYFCVLWSGPDAGWSSIWWAWCDSTGSLFAGDSFAVDGKRLGVFSWQWEANPRYGPYYDNVFHPNVIIHETGHALGLPDYYDYSTSAGPDGGIGGLDMMDNNWGDHNAFSKWLLGWLEPTVVPSAAQAREILLRPTAESPDAVAVMPGADGPFAEYFIVQNRTRVLNDTDVPTDGLLVWHVDARLNTNGDDFLYDNSYTDHKVLRLMEADGLEEIETGDGWADAGDFYTPGSLFSPDSFPDSASYAGAATGVTVSSIAAADGGFTAFVGIVPDGSQLGDINADGAVDISDILLLIQRIRFGVWPDGDGLPSDEYMEWAADVNEDGRVTAGDLLRLIRLL